MLDDLRERLERWRRETDDPLCNEAFFMPPETAQVADPNERSPKDAAALPARVFLGIE